MKINIEDKNLLDYSDWETDLSGSTSEFTQIAGGGSTLYQYRENDIDPFGDTKYVWIASVTTTGSTYGGGYVSSGITIDHTKIYRISQWCYRSNTGDTNNGYYFGFYNYNIDGTLTGATRSDGIYSTNLYVYQKISAGMAVVDGWFLSVGYLMPSTWTGNTQDYQGKIYYNSGLTNTSNAYNYKFNVNAKYLALRSYSPFNTSNYATTKFCYPRIDLVDGTEPSVATLLSNEGNWRTMDTGGTYINIEDYNLTQYNTWESGTTKPSNYQEISSSNVNLLLTTELDPYGNSGVCWNCIPINSAITTTYGFYPNIIDYDDTYDYRFSVWMKRTSGMSYNNYAFRVGFRIYNNDDPTYSYEYLKSVTSSASARGLSIYINDENFNTYLPIGDWVFCNIILRKFGTSENTNSVDSGYWINGTKIGIGNAYCDVTPSLSGSTKITVIVYMNNSIGDTEMLTIYPRLDKLDGTEPSIATLLSNEGQWRKINDMKINVGDDWKNTI